MVKFPIQVGHTDLPFICECELYFSSGMNNRETIEQVKYQPILGSGNSLMRRTCI